MVLNISLTHDQIKSVCVYTINIKKQETDLNAEFSKIRNTLKTETQADYHHLTCKVDTQFRNTFKVSKIQ